MKIHSLLTILLLAFSVLLSSCDKSASGSSGEATKEIQESTDSQESSNSDEDAGISNEASNDCERFIQKYSGWASRYEALATRMAQNPDDMSVLEQFTAMANEAAGWESQIPNCSDDKYVEQIQKISDRILQTAQRLGQ